MEDDQLEFAEDEGWRNSLAPNDGYYPRNRRHAKASDRRSSSRLSRRNSSIISLDMFNNFAYGMIRHMRNPEPNAPDQMMYKLWKKIGFYLPLTGIVSNYFSILVQSIPIINVLRLLRCYWNFLWGLTVMNLRFLHGGITAMGKVGKIYTSLNVKSTLNVTSTLFRVTTSLH